MVPGGASLHWRRRPCHVAGGWGRNQSGHSRCGRSCEFVSGQTPARSRFDGPSSRCAKSARLARRRDSTDANICPSLRRNGPATVGDNVAAASAPPVATLPRAPAIARPFHRNRSKTRTHRQPGPLADGSPSCPHRASKIYFGFSHCATLLTGPSSSLFDCVSGWVAGRLRG